MEFVYCIMILYAYFGRGFNMDLWDIGASTCGRRVITENLFEEYANVGIKHMEISLAHPVDRSDIEGEFNQHKFLDMVNLRKFAVEWGIDIWSYHLPFGPEHFNIAWTDSEIRNLTIRRYKELIKKSSDLDCKVVVIHPSGALIPDEIRGECINYATDALGDLVQVAKESGVTLAVENMPRTLCREAGEMAKVLHMVDGLKACFDVNHLLFDKHKDFIEQVGDKIVSVHLSDYDFVDEKHWIPGEGSIDWKELIDLLKSIDYTGPFMNEVRCRMVNEDSEHKYTYKELVEANKILLAKYF